MGSGQARLDSTRRPPSCELAGSPLSCEPALAHCQRLKRSAVVQLELTNGREGECPRHGRRSLFWWAASWPPHWCASRRREGRVRPAACRPGQRDPPNLVGTRTGLVPRQGLPRRRGHHGRASAGVAPPGGFGTELLSHTHRRCEPRALRPGVERLRARKRGCHRGQTNG